MGALETFLRHTWWVVVFLLSCLFVYEQEAKAISREYQRLAGLQHELEAKKGVALLQRQELQRQMQSQSDLQWIELALKRGLGLVPENQTKIYFSPKH